jgi:hypothetical protein
LDCGEILHISPGGQQTRGEFNANRLYENWLCRSRFYTPSPSYPSELDEIRQLKSVASTFGCTPEAIDSLLRDGFTTDELEEMLYCGEL